MPKPNAKLDTRGNAITINYDKQRIRLATGLGPTRTACRISFTAGLRRNDPRSQNASRRRNR